MSQTKMAAGATASANASASMANICVSCARQRQSRRCVGAGAAVATGCNAIMQIYSAWALLTLLAASAAYVQSAAVSFGDLLSHPTFKPLCSVQHEHFIESDGKESSLIIELKPGSYGAQHKSCSRILSAPPSYGFIVRLILPKLRHTPRNDNGSDNPSSAVNSNIMPALASANKQPQLPPVGILNATAAAAAAAAAANSASSAGLVVGRTCPLNIFSSLDPHTAQWRVDPCQLEDNASEMEDPVRLFHGRVRIVWEHGMHTLKSKLMVTVLGKGEQCKDASKHQCLKIGDEPILCISRELACDGIRHCPYSNEYDSDEDYELCYKQRRPGAGTLPYALESDLVEQFALEVFRNLFAYDAPTSPEDVPARNGSAGESETAGTATATAAAGVNSNTTTQLRKVHTKDMKKPDTGSPNAIGTQFASELDTKVQDNGTLENGNVNGSGVGSGFTRRNSTRGGLHSDLSKYGPWGYLMLGMLLCGGALLICGLWASASQHAVNNEREAALAAANGAGMDPTSATSPPNYEELDPPPAYSVLFPNQKAASSNTLNALDGAVASTTAAAAAAAAAAATAAITATTTTTTASLTTTTATEQSQQQQQPQQSGDEPTTTTATTATN